MLAHPDLGFIEGDTDFLRDGIFDACRAPFGVASELPGRAYTSSVFQDLENEKVWTRDWVCIGTAAQIANPGDLLPYTVGQHAIHAQRSVSGSLVGRFNKAQHGGCRSIPAQCRTGKKTKCSYTSCGFSKDHDVIAGDLLAEMTPQAGQYLGVNPERLMPVSIRVSGAFLFANVDPTLGRDISPPLVEAALDGNAMRVGGQWLERRANWKLAGAALVDAAHDTGILAQSHFPNLIILNALDASLAIVLQPTAFDQALWRLSFFKDNRCPDAVYDSAHRVLLDLVERAAAAAVMRQTEFEQPAAGEVVEHSRAAWEFNQQLLQRIGTQHVAYWNAPLTQAWAGR